MSTEKMKAAVYTNYGPPEIVEIKEIKKPIPKQDEVLVKVHASTVNRTDCGFRSANYFVVRFFSGLFKPNQQVLGCEFSGVIEAMGAEVTGYKVGHRVFGFNDKKFGGHAEFMLLHKNDAFCSVPNNLDFAHAAAIAEGAHYALFYIRDAKIAANQNVLIIGATGAIGSAAVQLIKRIGAKVTAVCGTEHLDLVKRLGADEVIDYLTKDYTKTEETFDVVFDAVGKSSFKKCKPLLKEKGIYTSTELGQSYENPFLAMYTPWLGGKKVLFPIPNTNKKDIEFLSECVSKGEFKPLIDRKYKLTEIIDAYKYVESGQKIGNVIIEIN